MDRVEESSTEVNISNNLKSSTYVGGLIGFTDSNTAEGLVISKSYSRVNINGNTASTTNAGGLIGEANVRNTIEESYAIGNINIGSNSGYVGGLIGYDDDISVISNAYANVEIQRTENNYAVLGGLIGYCYNGTINNTYAIGKIEKANGRNGTIGGLIGNYSYTPIVTNSYWLPETIGVQTTKSTVAGEAKTIKEMLFKENYIDWDFENVWKIEEGKSLPYLLDNKEMGTLEESIENKKLEGKGTEEEPFLIYTMEQLQYIEELNYVNIYCYKIMNNIDAKDYEVFSPIGENEKAPFRGILDGNGKTISNLKIESSNQYVGLFGYINGGTVKNITLENETVKGTYTIGESYIGGIAGYNETGLIEEVSITGSSKIEDATSNKINLGGLVGYQKGGQVKASYVEGEIVTLEKSYEGSLGGLIGYAYRMDKVEESSTKINIQNNLKSSTYIGGLIGFTNSDTTEGLMVNKNYSRVSISDSKSRTEYIGGLIGYSNYKDVVQKSYAIGNITVESNNGDIGGLIGYTYRNTEISNAYSNVEIERAKDNYSTVGGLIGYSYNSGVTINNTYAIGKVHGTNGSIGGLIGYYYNTPTITNSYWSPEIAGISVTTSTTQGEAKTIQEMLYKENYIDWDFENIWKIEEEGKSLPYLLNKKETEILEENIAYGIKEGKGTEEDPFLIHNTEELQYIEKLNYKNEVYYYKLMDDIDAKDYEGFIPIGTYDIPFRGILDGDGKTISNLTIESSDRYVGLFGYVNGGIVRNLTLENEIVKGTYALSGESYIGGIAGYSEAGLIEGVNITGSSKIEDATSYAINLGGLVGYQKGGQVKASYVEGEIITPEKITYGYLGGLIGYAYTMDKVEESSTKVEIHNNIKMQYNSRIIVYVGGLIGYAYSNTTEGLIINRNYSIVNILGNKAETVYAGGLIGYADCKNVIQESYAIGNITVETNSGCIGGLIGYSNNNTDISNAYSNVEIERTQYNSTTVGGLVGYYNSGTISNVYAIGKIHGINGSRGGLIGAYRYTPTITNSYWLPETVGIITTKSTVGGEAKIIQEMLYKENYIEWDFENVWKIEEEGKSLPYLLNKKETEILEENIGHGIKEGKGTEEDPFLIHNIEELQHIENLNYKNEVYYYKLINDIDAKDYEGFIPIGQTIDIPFKGILDGDGKTITNLKIESSNQYVGLFGYINHGIVKNLILENETVKGTNTSGESYIGGISGYNEAGLIEGVRITGSSKIEDATSYALNLGGLVGYQKEGQVKASYVEGEITTPEKSTYGYLGGLIGYANNVEKVEECSTKINIQNNLKNSSSYVGGLIGYAVSGTTEGLLVNKNYSKVSIEISPENSAYAGGLIGITSGKNTIEESYAIGNINVRSNSSIVGGLIGHISGSSYTRADVNINNAYTKIEIERTENGYGSMGGLIGENNYNNGSINNAYAIGKIYGTYGNLGGLIGYCTGGTPTVTNSYWSPETVGVSATRSTIGESKTIQEMLYKENYIDWDFENVWKIEENGKSLPYLLNNKETEILGENINYGIKEGKGTEEDPFLIYTTEQLQHIENLNKVDTYYYKIMNDIDAKDYEGFSPIGTSEVPFKGILDGNGKKISNLKIESKNQYVGLFGYISSGTVKNLTLENESVKGSYAGNESYIGGLVGGNYDGIIEGIKITGMSKIEDASIENGKLYIGGVIGYNSTSTKISEIYAEGEIITSSREIQEAYIGGLIAYNNYGSLYQSSSKVNISNNLIGSKVYIGGIVSYHSSGRINNMEASGSIKNLANVTSLYAGHIAGYNRSYITRTHGNGTIENFVNVTNAYIAGIVGYNTSSVTFSYNTGKIITNNIEYIYAGGIVGYTRSEETTTRSQGIYNSYSKGILKVNSVTANVGGIAGYSYDTIANTYSIEDISINATNIGLGYSGNYYNINGIGQNKTLEELKQQDTYFRWDFNEIWTINENEDTPSFTQKLFYELNYADDNYWEWHSRTTDKDKAYNGYHIVFKDNIQFYGYGQISYKDFLYKNYEYPGNKKFSFTLREASTNWHTLDGSGFIFNAKKQGNYLSGYIILLEQKKISLYRMSSVNVDSFKTTNDRKVASYASLITSVDRRSSSVHDFVVETSPTHVTVTDNNVVVLDRELTYYSDANDFALITSYLKHNCPELSRIEFSDFRLEVDNYSLPIYKTDEDGNPLQGAEFQVKNEEGEVIRKGVTGEDGKVGIEGLVEGTYTFEEVKPPATYMLDTEKYPFKMTSDGRILDVDTDEEKTFTIINKPLKFELKNYIANSETAIQGSKIQLYDIDGNEIIGKDDKPIIGTTDEEGKVVFTGIESGVYKYKQINVPAGYVLDEEFCTLSIVDDGTVTYVEDENGKGKDGIIYNDIVKSEEGKTKIKKYKKDTTIPLSGAIIGLYDEEGNPLFDSEGNHIKLQPTDESGETGIPALEYGTYQYKEETAPIGYVLNETMYKFKVNNDATITFEEDTEGIIYNQGKNINLIFNPGENATIDIETKEVIYGEPYGELPIPEKEGHTFEGWHDEEGNVLTPEDVIEFTEDVELYANWTVNTSTITFDPREGILLEEEKTKEVTYGKSCGDFPIPEKEGYTFNGWKDEEGNKVNPENIEEKTENMTKDITLYADWIANKKTITFDPREGTLLEEEKIKEVVYGEPCGDFPTPERTGYIFNGWKDEENNEFTLENVDEIKGDITLYAEWTPKKSKVTFEPREGTLKEDEKEKEVTYDEPYGELPIPEKTGYDFEGWVDEDGNEVNPDDIVDITEDKTVIAKWTPKKPKITFDPDGGILEEDKKEKEVTYDEPYGELPIPEKTGYNFEGWYDEEGKEVKPEYVVNITEDKTLTAHWVKADYTVTFDPNGGTVNPTIKAVANGKPYGDLPVPEKKGYVFEGWYITEDKEIESTTIVDITTDITVKAKWTPKKSKVTFDPGEGTLEEDQKEKQVIYDGPYGELPIPEKPGYDFEGWLDDEGNEVEPDDIVDNTEDEILIAKWTPKKSIITFDPDGGTLEEDEKEKEVIYDEPYGDFPIPEKSGYSFEGWYDDDGKEIKPEDVVNITEDKTLTAHWVEADYIVRFDPNGGTVNPSTKAVANGKTYGDLPIPEKKGYVFEGWYITEDEEIESTTIVDITTDITVKAKWTPKKSKVTFDPGEGILEEDQKEKEVIYDGPYGELPIPEKPGYDFEGWLDDEGNEVDPDDIVDNTEDEILIAKWTPKKLKITFDSDGGALEEDEKEKEVTYDESYGELPIPEKPGYSFEGWYNEEGNKVDEKTIVDTISDITLYAKYKIKEYTIIYKNVRDCDNSQNPLTYTIEDDDIVLKDLPDQGKFVFKGWYTTNDEKGTKVTKINTSEMKDITLYAQWEYDRLYFRSDKYKVGINDIDVYEDGDVYLDKIEPDTTVEDFIKNCDTNGKITVIDEKGNVLKDNDLVGTTMTVRVTRFDEEITMTAVVMGDIDGDGKATTQDLSELNKAYLGTSEKELVGARFMAADIDDSGVISATDLSELNRASLEISKLTYSKHATSITSL